MCIRDRYAPLLEILEQMGCTVERARDAAAISRFGALRGAGNVHTAPYPGLATDAAPLLAAVLLPWFVRLVELISPKGPELEVISRQIANAHTLFNLGCTVLWLPLTPCMVRIVCILLPEKHAPLS